MELYTMHIICSLRMDPPYLLLEKDQQQNSAEVDETPRHVIGMWKRDSNPEEKTSGQNDSVNRPGLTNQDFGFGQIDYPSVASLDLDKHRHNIVGTTAVQFHRDGHREVRLTDRPFDLLKNGRREVMKRFMYETDLSLGAHPRMDSMYMLLKSFMRSNCTDTRKPVQALCKSCLQSSGADDSGAENYRLKCLLPEPVDSRKSTPNNLSHSSSYDQRFLVAFPHLSTGLLKQTLCCDSASLLQAHLARNEENSVQHNLHPRHDQQLNTGSPSLEKLAIDLPVYRQAGSKHDLILPDIAQCKVLTTEQTSEECQRLLTVKICTKCQHNFIESNHIENQELCVSPIEILYEDTVGVAGIESKKIYMKGSRLNQVYTPDITPDKNISEESAGTIIENELSESYYRQMLNNTCEGYTSNYARASQTQCAPGIGQALRVHEIEAAGINGQGTQVCCGTSHPVTADQNGDMVCIDLPLTNFGFYSGEVTLLL